MTAYRPFFISSATGYCGYGFDEEPSFSSETIVPRDSFVHQKPFIPEEPWRDAIKKCDAQIDYAKNLIKKAILYGIVCIAIVLVLIEIGVI